MHKTSFRIPDNASIFLTSVIRRQTRRQSPSAASRQVGFRSAAPVTEAVQKSETIALLVETNDPSKLIDAFPKLEAEERIEVVGDRILSAIINVDTAADLVKNANALRIQNKILHQPNLDSVLPDIGLRPLRGAVRQVQETGNGVLIGVIDTGFDLTHPMFRDANGNLRVEGLLDQTDKNLEYTTAQLQTAWGAGGAGSPPGFDLNGHGTHVASIAGGSSYQNLEGIAPNARFLLVRSDFLNTDKALQWVFAKAGNTPCVVNMSLGHHFGAHDGTSLEEQLQESLTDKGKIIVVSAGNERTDSIHLGGHFIPNQTETVAFDVLPPRDGSDPAATLTLWYDKQDNFEVALVSPSGQALTVPAPGSTDRYNNMGIDLELSRKVYTQSNLIQVQIAVAFSKIGGPSLTRSSLRFLQPLEGWKLRLTCLAAATGRLDAWMSNSGYAVFRPHPFVEQGRTIGMPATGRGCLAVASHISKNTWDNNDGPQKDAQVLQGWSSPFSSLGPTRDGRWKPEIAAPGQYVTAALGDRSELAAFTDRTLTNNGSRLLTIEGTSMSAPVVTGAVALLLEKKRNLTLSQILEALKKSARHDIHNGPEAWTPAYGYGKLDIAAALAAI